MAHLNTSTHVVLCRCHWDGVSSNVKPILLALLSNIGEVLQNLLSGLVTDVQQDMALISGLHLVLNGARHNVARCQIQATVIVRHKSACKRVLE